ncbi:hypothetical protein HLH17_11605 [Acinetobacter sp. ANC 5380]|uniref:Uncharacterized protein n=1 Tax=Acinetobacter terrae TaxID=2731247 RepID=A0A7Y2WC08_9GAMM|nr:hypothetical protein [Acinetobacter terrae]NNH78303.1 hypothetical protein [Acinetobacter terrae]
MKLKITIFSALLLFMPLTTVSAELLTQEEFNKDVKMRIFVIEHLNDTISEKKAESNRTGAIQTFCFYNTAVEGLRDSAIDNIDLAGATSALKLAAIKLQRINEIFEKEGTSYYEICKGPRSIWNE